MKSARRVPYVLMLTAQDLCTRSNLCSISDDRLSQDAITSDVNARADASFWVSEKRTEGDSAGHRTLREGQMIITNSKIVADAAWNHRTEL